MCADESEDLVEKACHFLIDGDILRVVQATKKKVIRRNAATLALSDGEVFYKKIKKEFDRARGK